MDNLLKHDLTTRRVKRSRPARSFSYCPPLQMKVTRFTLFGDANIECMRDDRRVFMILMMYQGVAGIRVTFSRWPRKKKDVEIA